MSREARQVLDQAMTEDALLEAVVEMAERLGWRVAHIPDRLYKLAAKERRYDAMRGAKGLPDLILVRRGVLVFAELKTETGELEAEQVEWRDDLTYVADFIGELGSEIPKDMWGAEPVTWHLWRPSDYSSGAIEEVLR